MSLAQTLYLPVGCLLCVQCMEWFKFYGGAYLSDPKMLMLTASERSCWVTLLSYASVAEDGGRIKYLTEEQLMIAASVNPMDDECDKTIGVFTKFEKLGMINLSNGIVTVKNWQKRQETYLTNAERQKRYRDKQKSNAEVTDSRNDSNARIEENRIDIGEETSPIVISSEEDTQVVRPNRRVKDKEAVYKLFSSKKEPWMNHKQQREAALRLFDRGLNKLQRGLEVMGDGGKYCPKAYTPFEYEEKLPKLNAYIKENGL